jgi:hypothetical protein
VSEILRAIFGDFTSNRKFYDTYFLTSYNRLDSNSNNACVLEVGKNFVDFLNNKIVKGDVTEMQVCADIGIKSYKDFSYDITKGRKKLSVEYICKAKEKYNYTASHAFGETFIEAADDSSTFENSNTILNPNISLLKHIGSKLDSIFRKHKTAKETYANNRLEKSRQQLHKVMAGNSRMYLDEAVMICQDLGESLDQFRTVPLPKGHYLQKMELQTQLIEHQKNEIELLRRELNNYNSGNQQRASA